MIDFFFLVPIAIGLGLAGLASFMWTLKNRQYDDLEGAAQRILFEANEGPLIEKRRSEPTAMDPIQRATQSPRNRYEQPLDYMPESSPPSARNIPTDPS
jgi:cbb3-type cytochrome oxidase maturation protein